MIGISRIGCRYSSKAPKQEGLRRRIIDIANSRFRYGYKRIHVMLKREGFQLILKRLKRKVIASHRKRTIELRAG